MTVLSPNLRSVLEKATVAARDAAEEACSEALSELGIQAERAGEHLSEGDRRLRVALRADGRQLGGFDRLVEESAYEQWHRMLFARFLAENDLLIHPEHGVAVSLADCEEIAHARGHSDLWVVASEFASTMLPGIFRSDDPILQLNLAPEGQQRLEQILADLPRELFTSEDGLGWAYQYWQAKKKKEVNASGRKIGGADIAPVTQLFTENYMVRFLLENTLGSWWAAHHPESPLVREWEYLRSNAEDEPAAGRFTGWPDAVAEVTVMDPCCGSGHFLVVAFEMLRKMRMEEEDLSAAEAGDAVLEGNLFGLELDPRCTQIAAFALALQAWKTGGYRQLPIPNVACSGISAKGRLEDWKKLARGDARLELSLERLHALFSDADDLGSLIDPLRELDGELLVAQFEDVYLPLEAALSQEAATDPSTAIFGSAAVAAMRAAQLLAGRYTLVVTNPPFLGRNKQDARLKEFCERRYPLGKADLATCFIERHIAFLAREGSAAMVTPQNWTFLTRYGGLRGALLRSVDFDVVAHLGEHAFETGQAAGAFVSLVIFTNQSSTAHVARGLDASVGADPASKQSALRSLPLESTPQLSLMGNGDERIVFGGQATGPALSEVAIAMRGIVTGDRDLWVRTFWELPTIHGTDWRFLQSTVTSMEEYGGRSFVIDWSTAGSGMLRPGTENEAYGRKGVVVSLMRGLMSTLYTGELYDNNCSPIVPSDERDVPAIWEFVRSGEFAVEVRKIDRKVNVTNATLTLVPFDIERWRKIARERYPAGVPKARSQDPTQWLFDGSPCSSTAPLQAAVARIAGYGWPRQSGSGFPDCPALGPDGLESFADSDGIVCIPSVRGERPAAERLRALLAASFADGWSPAKEADMVGAVGHAGKSLEEWLRDSFFEQHCLLFHQRPFIWHVWDGRRDGFSAVVNYHRLDRANLEKLIYTYLGDWIRAQGDGAAAGTAGADLRLAAAQELQGKLELILEGEVPHDVFVRWKPIEEQPLGWEPDLDDGVRLNIRPFVAAGVLRKNPKVKWNKDRGKDPESAPWYDLFKGDRINDHHLTLVEKRAAREIGARKSA